MSYDERQALKAEKANEGSLFSLPKLPGMDDKKDEDAMASPKMDAAPASPKMEA